MSESRWKIRKRRKHLKEFDKHLRHIMHVNDDIIPAASMVRMDELLIEVKSIDPADQERFIPFIEDTEGVLDDLPFLDFAKIICLLVQNKSWSNVILSHRLIGKKSLDRYA